MKAVLFFKNGDEKAIDNLRHISKLVRFENNIPVFTVRFLTVLGTKEYKYSEISSVEVYDSDCTWIEDRTDLVCPCCGIHLDDEIKFMAHGEMDFLKFCPNYGRRMK